MDEGSIISSTVLFSPVDRLFKMANNTLTQCCTEVIVDRHGTVATTLIMSPDIPTCGGNFLHPLNIPLIRDKLENTMKDKTIITQVE